MVCSFHMIQEQTRKPHPNPKLLEKLWIVDGGPFFPHDPVSFYVCIACVFINFIIFFLQTYPFPVSITIIHLIVKFLLAWLVRRVVAAVTKEAPNVLTWPQYLKNICAVG